MRNFDQQFMRHALARARRAPLTVVAPNPRVGAVVKNGKIIGGGYHAKFGGPHAEAVALSRCKVSPRGATLYVTLEPCCHWGKTPPCTEAIFRAGIKKVIYAIEDPHPFMKGKGMKILRQKGIKVEILSPLERGGRGADGVCVHEAKRLNESFFYFHRSELPFVAVKVATSLDGRIATRRGDSKWITSEAARKYAREKIRSEYQAILAGVNTILRDDPCLCIRKKGVTDPVRIIFDSALQTPLRAKVLRDERVILCVSNKVESYKIKKFERKGVKIWKFTGRRIPIQPLLRRLAREGINSVLVEGGGEVIGSFMDAKAINKVYWFHAPIIIGGREAIPSVGGTGAAKLLQAIHLKRVEHTQIDRDMLTIGYTSRDPTTPHISQF